MLGWFFPLASGIGSGVVTVLILRPSQIEAPFREPSYTTRYILAVYSPGLAGVFLVWRHCGVRGLGRYLRWLGWWRMPTGWRLVLLSIPAVRYAARR